MFGAQINFRNPMLKLIRYLYCRTSWRLYCISTQWKSRKGNLLYSASQSVFFFMNQEAPAWGKKKFLLICLVISSSKSILGKTVI